jgi:hypothetical protein
MAIAPKWHLYWICFSSAAIRELGFGGLAVPDNLGRPDHIIQVPGAETIQRRK